MPPRRHRAGRAVVLVTAALALVACGGGSPGSETSSSTDPRATLLAAKAKVDAARALHFAITSDNAGGTSTYLKGGEGDASRPDGFAGSFDVFYKVAAIHIAVVSSGGTFFVQLPFVRSFEKTDPSQYGFSDPGKLIDPEQGLSSLLAKEESAAFDGSDRYQGEELDEIKVILPGDLVARLLTSADPTAPVDGEVGISRSSGEVRRVRMTGPFFARDRQSTYTVILTNYGESVTVTPPA